MENVLMIFFLTLKQNRYQISITLFTKKVLTFLQMERVNISGMIQAVRSSCSIWMMTMESYMIYQKILLIRMNLCFGAPD